MDLSSLETEERELILRCQAGDGAAFEPIVTRYMRRAAAFAGYLAAAWPLAGSARRYCQLRSPPRWICRRCAMPWTMGSKKRGRSPSPPDEKKT